MEQVDHLLELVAIGDRLGLLRPQRQRHTPVAPGAVGMDAADRVTVFHAGNQAAVGKNRPDGGPDIGSVAPDLPDRTFELFRSALPVQGCFGVGDLPLRRGRGRGAHRIGPVQEFVIVVHAVAVGIIRRKHRLIAEMLPHPVEKLRMGALVARFHDDRTARGREFSRRIECRDGIPVIPVRSGQPDVVGALSGHGRDNGAAVEHLEADGLKRIGIRPVPAQAEHVDVALESEIVRKIRLRRDNLRNGTGLRN